MNVRPYDATDREEARVLLGDVRAVDDPRNRVHVAEGERGRLAGVAVWHEPDAGEPDGLAVVLTGGSSQDTLYRLVLACVEDAMTRGHRAASFSLQDPGLLRRLERDFTISPLASGWRRGIPVEWTVRVDLVDARAQLLARSA